MLHCYARAKRTLRSGKSSRTLTNFIIANIWTNFKLGSTQMVLNGSAVQGRSSCKGGHDLWILSGAPIARRMIAVDLSTGNPTDTKAVWGFCYWISGLKSGPFYRDPRTPLWQAVTTDAVLIAGYRRWQPYYVYLASTLQPCRWQEAVTERIGKSSLQSLMTVKDRFSGSSKCNAIFFRRNIGVACAYCSSNNEWRVKSWLCPPLPAF